jgi:hypothetical protein
MARTPNDLTGQVFGRLTATGRVPDTKYTTWACLCACGKVKNVRADNLTAGRSTSCGCSKGSAVVQNKADLLLAARHAHPKLDLTVDIYCDGEMAFGVATGPEIDALPNNPFPGMIVTERFWSQAPKYSINYAAHRVLRMLVSIGRIPLVRGRVTHDEWDEVIRATGTVVRIHYPSIGGDPMRRVHRAPYDERGYRYDPDFYGFTYPFKSIYGVPPAPPAPAETE